MANSEQLRIGSAIARFFSGGGGPSHSAISSALMAAGYDEPHVDMNQNKQERVNSAFRKSMDPDIQQNLVKEFLLTLYDSGSLDSDTTPDYKRLVRALQRSGLGLDKDGFLIEADTLLPEKNQERVMTTIAQEPSTEVSGDPGRRRRVLISHADVDTNVASQVARFIEIVFRLEKAQILCTSVDGYGLDPGEVWIDALRQAIRDGDLIVFLISKGFLSSDFCGFELGAAWMASDELQRFPMRFPDVDAEQLSALPGSWHCPAISETVLSLLVDRMVQRCHLQQPPATHLTSELAETMKNINSVWKVD